MRRILIRVAYDGTGFFGSQIQRSLPTVESILADAVEELTGENVRVHGASRTDAGVHALGAVFCFDTESRIPGEKFALALNTKLLPMTRVVESREVAKDFNPRHGVLDKTYEYHIDDGFIELPTKRMYSTHVKHRLDIERMNEAAKYIIGEHDFTSFCSTDTDQENHVRTIYDLHVRANRDDDPLSHIADADPESERRIAALTPHRSDNRDVIISVTGSGFLYNMVRIIAGTLVSVGEGKIAPDLIPAIIEAKDRRKAGPTLPAKGLFLVDVRYEQV